MIAMTASALRATGASALVTRTGAVEPAGAGDGDDHHWDVQRPGHVDPAHWHQALLHACSQARIDRLVAFAVGPDQASFWLAPGPAHLDPDGRPAALTQLLAEVVRVGLPPAGGPASAPRPHVPHHCA